MRCVLQLNEAGEFPENTDVVVAPTALHLGAVADKLRKDVNVACQNIGKNAAPGAFTGELTAGMVKGTP